MTTFVLAAGFLLIAIAIGAYAYTEFGLDAMFRHKPMSNAKAAQIAKQRSLNRIAEKTGEKQRTAFGLR